MVKTALDLSPRELNCYKPSQAGTEVQNPERWHRAWQLVPKLARLLRQQFGATRIRVFGSLSDRQRFSSWSDIDLAVWDIPASKFYQAVAAVTGTSQEFKVDLIDIADCSPRLRQTIEETGIEIEAQVETP